jgi:hypothetical protein
MFRTVPLLLLLSQKCGYSCAARINRMRRKEGIMRDVVVAAEQEEEYKAKLVLFFDPGAPSTIVAPMDHNLIQSVYTAMEVLIDSVAQE